MPPADATTQNTPLAPSVEKAYYRKCIALKRRLNDVETANDEAKIRRVRLERSILKMRLERAFLLDELRKRMDHNIEASDGSVDEGLATPPPDRPHRDKRRRQAQAPPAPSSDVPPGANPDSAHHRPLAAQRNSSMHGLISNGMADLAANSTLASDHPSRSRGSPYGNPVGLPTATSTMRANGNAAERVEDRPTDREAGVTDEPIAVGAVLPEGANGDKKPVSRSSADNANVESQQTTRSGFTSVNN